MYVCLCAGITKQCVTQAVLAGAATTGEVARSCGAGAECGRCRRTVRAVIDAVRSAQAASQPEGI
ncbi:(2Fe-2S)-binding protein [Mycolicibacterium sp.]|uniref:(2Fe-2S)-binding protein n=1 Tax=Mycolicibacterium sp. TaxID=2320850 RepID=UPI001A1B76E5|nr:(2Fe-2S)-binding protein [Mycolicibacterium sp.]MBJ7337231.1 (2Fe-2S)-binding protein [Mycolicibacterium sp.]